MHSGIIWGTSSYSETRGVRALPGLCTTTREVEMHPQSICSMSDCGSPAHARGLCSSHYNRLLRYGNPSGGSFTQQPSHPCAVDGCDALAKKRGWCDVHYTHWQKYGDPLAGPFAGRSVADRFWEKVNKNGPIPEQCPELGPCWVFTSSPNEQGYCSFWDGVRPVRAHRFSYELHYGVSLGELDACHKCDNPPCVNPLHLFPGTNADNNRDRDAKGRTKVATGDASGARVHPERRPRGERHGCAKLTEAQVIKIRQSVAEGESRRLLAELFGIDRSTVNYIVSGKLWKHLLAGHPEQDAESRLGQ